MKVYPVFIPHAGCPHQCLFCAQDRTTGQVDVPAPQAVASWLDEVLPPRGGGEVAFYGGTFSLLPQPQQDAYLTVAGRYVTAGRVEGIRISTRPDALSERCLLRLRDAGVRTIEIGCQSLADTVLARAGRGHTAADCVSAVQRCRRHGFTVGVQLMPGLPGGDAAEALASLQQALDLEPAFLRIYPAVVVRGTGLAELWADGSFQPWTLDDTVDVCAQMLLLCRQRQVPVIRLGLQQDPQLAENLLAGPYHPAFGQLVRSRLWRRLLCFASKSGSAFSVNPADLSDALGHRCENRDWLKACCRGFSLTADSAVRRGFLRTSGRDIDLYDPAITGVNQ